MSNIISKAWLDAPPGARIVKKVSRHKGYADLSGTGPAGQTCGRCKHQGVNPMGKHDHKCALVAFRWGDRHPGEIGRLPTLGKGRSAAFPVGTMTKDEKQAKLRELCRKPGIMTGAQLAEASESNGQGLPFDRANRPVVTRRKMPCRNPRPKTAASCGL